MKDGIRLIGKIDREIYKCVTPVIVTDEVVITDERIAHIKERHPDDYERFMKYLPEIIKTPDYIIQAGKRNTAVVLKEIEGNGEKFNLILRLKVGSDPKAHHNSILSLVFAVIR